MNAIVRTISLPVPRVPIEIRTATMADLSFLDALQKKNSKALGYFPTKQFEGYIEGGFVLIAEESSPQRHRDTEACPNGDAASVVLCLCGSTSLPKPLGYVISKDRYLKRDELGVIYQLCVVPGEQRKLVAASLIKATFERAAYGCRLFCCWCAQDLDANYFWESLGFVPIACRAGSGKKRRVHIFWQKRIDTELPIADCQASNESNSNRKSQIGDRQSPTPYWYPFKTDSGAIREDRIVLPIPPGVHWRDVQPPEMRRASNVEGKGPKLGKALADGSGVTTAHSRPTTSIPGPRKNAALARQVVTQSSALRFAPPVSSAPLALSAPTTPVKSEKPRREKKPAAKIDPKYLAAARELRDRYLERVNETAQALASCGKYDVSRLLPPARDSVPPMPLVSQPLPQLTAAA